MKTFKGGRPGCEIACPLCGSKEVAEYSLHSLMRCVSCALVFNPSLYAEDIDHAMMEEYFPGAFRSDRADRFFEKIKNKRMLGYLGQSPRGRRILEIGVGSGAFLNMARIAGFEVSGLDISPAIAEDVRKKYNIPVTQGQLCDFKPDRSYDVIVMMHVLEHLSDPGAALADIQKLLSPDGVVLIAVPNIRAFEAYLPGWLSYQPYHLYYFSASNITALFTRSGYRLLRVFTFEPFSGWLLSLGRTFCARQTKGTRVTPVGGKMRDSSTVSLLKYILFIFGTVLGPLRAIQSFLGYGEELIVIARKRMNS